MMREGINPTTGAALEIANRILFGLEDMRQAKDVRRIMSNLEIRQAAVIFEEPQAQLLADQDSLYAKWRPVVGGIQH